MFHDPTRPHRSYNLSQIANCRQQQPSSRPAFSLVHSSQVKNASGFGSVPGAAITAAAAPCSSQCRSSSSSVCRTERRRCFPLEPLAGAARGSSRLPTPAAAAEAHRQDGAAAGASWGPGVGRAHYVCSQARTLLSLHLHTPTNHRHTTHASLAHNVPPQFGPSHLQDHPKLGSAGEVVTVKAGYARHSLYPTKAADYATPGVLRVMKVRWGVMVGISLS